MPGAAGGGGIDTGIGALEVGSGAEYIGSANGALDGTSLGYAANGAPRGAGVGGGVILIVEEDPVNGGAEFFGADLRPKTSGSANGPTGGMLAPIVCAADRVSGGPASLGSARAVRREASAPSALGGPG